MKEFGRADDCEEGYGQKSKMRILIVDDDVAIIEVIKDTVNWDKLKKVEPESPLDLPPVTLRPFFISQSVLFPFFSDRGTPESEDIISFEQREYGSFVVICGEMDPVEIKNRCTELIKKIENLLECTLTCCISRPCRIDEFYEVYHRNGDLLSKNIVYYGEAFLEDAVPPHNQRHGQADNSPSGAYPSRTDPLSP